MKVVLVVCCVFFFPGTKIKLESNIKPEAQIQLTYVPSLSLHRHLHLVNKKHKRDGLGKLGSNTVLS